MTTGTPRGGPDSPGRGQRRHRPPAELIVVVVLTYAAGFLGIGVGILFILAGYVTDIPALGGPFGVTLLGAGVILLGLFIIALASALTRGKHYARVATTVVVAVELALALVTLLGGGASVWLELLLIAVAVLIVLVLWLGRTGRYFARVSALEAAQRRSSAP